MSTNDPIERVSPPASADILDSWKEIAGHLNRDIRTVQRWERTRGLPVQRLPGGVKPGVYALKRELDAWWNQAQFHLGGVPDTGAVNPGIPAVAVLPFANLSADKENEYFSDGLADEIITALTRIPGLRVTARTSSFAFRGKQQDVRKIGAALGVGAVLEGSVQRSERRVRVSAQLVSASDGFHLWGEHFDCNLEDVFVIQDEIAQAIATALKVRLAPLPTARRTASLAAYHLWLKGRHYEQYASMEAIANCRACFEQAIEIDPSFPHPYLGLAEWYRAISHYGLVSGKDAGGQGWAAIRKAFDLDDSLGEAYALSGTYRAWIDFDWEGAQADFRRAAVLNPTAIEAHWLRAKMCLVPLNRLDEAVQEMERTIELDPLSPLMHSHFAWLLGFKRQIDLALDEIDTALALDPEHPVALALRGSMLYYGGRFEEGAASWQLAVDKMGRASTAIGALGYGLARVGRHAEARAILSELDAGESKGYVTPISRAWVYIGLGDFDVAFDWLDHAIDQRDPHILHLPCKPIYDPMRQDARFGALLRRMQLN